MHERGSREPVVEVGARPLTVDDVVAVARGGARARLTDAAREAIERGREVVVRALEEGRPVYGVTTGFGALSDVPIPAEDRERLQRNLLRSHASGTGAPLPDDVVRAALLLRARALAQGYSGVRPIVVERLLDLLNAGIHPVVPAQGSVGASGDLAPLAHLSLPLIGEGQVRVDGRVQDGREALRAAGIEPLVLEAKEALALINGTQIMASLAALAVADSQRLIAAAEIAVALSFEALEGHPEAYAPELQGLRPHPGQIAVADRLRALLATDGPAKRLARRPIQDAYTLRCAPQVLGPIRSAIDHARATIEVEVNAVTDNPLCFPDTGEIVSGGNFHGHPVALVCDYLKTAIASLGTYAERRIASLVDSRSSGLPAFLTPAPGLNSGYMIAQYVAASLASESKVLAHPASVDSIPTSADIEDFNSMGTTAARHLAQVVANTTRIVAIELLCAAQALDLAGRRPLAPATAAAYDAIRQQVPFLTSDDRSIHDLIERAAALIAEGALEDAVEATLAAPPR